MRLRFAREAANASKLDHPNVVNVIDYGRTEHGLNYLVMDLVEGVPLGKLVQQGPMPADRAIRIAHQLAEGLEHAHGHGVIHRDFKADNILIVGEPGREVARIADFGLAMSTSNDVRLTTSGVACTPAYAAPEQLRGQPFDHRVDLYGLGATLFEMLSGGYLPFEGDLDATVRAKLTHEAPSIVTRAPNVPPGLVTLVARLLAYDPEERPKSARAVIRALETSMTLPRPPIRTIEIAPVEVKKRGRRRTLETLLFVGTLAGLAVIVRHADEHGGAMPEVAVASAEAAVPAAAVLPPPVAQPAVAPPVVEPPAPVAALPAPAPAAPAPSLGEAQPRAVKVARTKPVAKPLVQRAPAGDSDNTDVQQGVTASTVATKYGAIGRQLQALEDAQGMDITMDLWRQYRRIVITDAMATQQSRDEASGMLDQIQRAISERQQ
jgi:serine/threonine-protein kinase